MFTGIIEGQGKVMDLRSESNAIRIWASTGWKDLALGESIAVNGVCLTVAEFTAEGDAYFFVSTETLDRSNLKTLKTGDRLNLERALTLQTRISGHYVQGHVDGIAPLLETAGVSESGPDQNSYRMKFEIPSELSRYCVAKGSIALNGVSLTINSLSATPAGDVAEVMIIPHTWSHTNLSCLNAGQSVNVEVDILAKYVERLCHR